MKEKDLTPLRTYRYNPGEAITLEELKDALEAVYETTGYKLGFGKRIVKTDGLFKTNPDALVVYNSEHMNDYFEFVFYFTENKRFAELQMRVGGKSKQAKHDIFAKEVKVFNGSAIKGIARGVMVGGSFGAGMAVGSIAGSAIGGSVRLIRKGINALLRDEEAYKAELEFYEIIIAATDQRLAV